MYPQKKIQHTYSPLLAVVLFLLFIIISALASAQVSDAYILNKKPVYIKNFNERKPGANTVVLKMDFGKPDILNPADVKMLEGKSILKVELIMNNILITNELP